MALALYLVTAAALLLVWSRKLQQISRGAALALVLLPMVFTGPALLTGRVYAPIDHPFQYEPLRTHAREYGVEIAHNISLSDYHCQFIPWHKAVRYALAQGEWPLWNPFILSGDILAAAAQPAAYDPLNLLALVLPLPDALTFLPSLTFFLAGFFAFAYARELGCGEAAALTGAAGFALSSMMGFAAAAPSGRSWAMLPLVFFATRRLVRQPAIHTAALLTGALVMVVLAGHPESLLHVVSLGAAYGVFELALARRNPTRAMAFAIGAGVVALLLTAVYLMPLVDALEDTAELVIRSMYADTDYDILVKMPRRIRRLGMTFLPFYGGQPWRGNAPGFDPLSARVGSVIVTLAICAPLLKPRRAEMWFLVAMALVCLAVLFAIPPIAHGLHQLPLFDIAINERLAIGAAFALSMLAAIAVDALPRQRSLAFLPVAIAVLLFGAVAIVRASQIAQGVPERLITTMTIAELVPLAALALLLAFRVPARIVAPAILALVLLQRAYEDGSMVPTLPKRVFYPRIGILAAIPTSAPEPFRTTGIGYTLIPNGAAMYELEDVRGYETMTFRRLTETYPLWSRAQGAWFNVIEDPSRPFLSFLNIRYAMTEGGVPEPWRVVKEEGGARLMENPNVLPRAFVPRRIRYEREGTAVLEGMKGVADFGDVAWIETPEYEPHEIANGPGTVTIRRKGLRYEIDASMERDGWIVISESAWNGWRAYVDGKRLRPRFANHAFLGVFVPAGQHQVRLVYLPESFTRGRAISLGTLALLIAATIARVCLRSRSTSLSPPP